VTHAPEPVGNSDFLLDGFAIYRPSIDHAALDHIVDALEEARSQTRTGRHAGFRDVFAVPALAALAENAEFPRLASALLGKEAFIVRALFFDKTAEANWKVAWHQDLTICVHERMNVAGFGPWSLKEGVPHVQPPVEILEWMVTLRLHLDDCDQSNGALRVLPGSHLGGKLGAAAIESWRALTTERVCAAARGEILAMRPLLLHASSTASEPRHRRVLHLDFAGEELPDGLRWRAMVGQSLASPAAAQCSSFDSPCPVH
jgi:ectoine hydroxylase-related dioxygenase (phytanoyl-CoA dioxygenase family)